MAGDSANSPQQWFTWERICNALNLKDIPKILRDTEFWAGVIVRVATLVGFFLFLFYAGDINDMNDLVYQGLIKFLQGINPYGQTYHLSTFVGPVDQDYFNYPPFALLLHLPIFLWPGPQSIGTMDFMPGFFLLHTFFSFVIYYRLWQEGHQVISKVIWINPFFVFVDIITFMSLPLLLLNLTLLNLKKPIRSGLYSLLLAATYQMGGIFVPFLLVYNWRRGSLQKNLLGMILPLIIVLFFFIWNPILFVRDLLVMQIGRPPVNWLDNSITSPYYNRYYPLAFLFMGSIPSLLFNLAIFLGVPSMFAPQIALPMMTLVLILAIFFLVYFSKHTRRALAIFFPGVLLALFIASTAEGLSHYWVLCVTLPFLFWTQKDSFYPPTKSSNTTPSPATGVQTIKTHSNKERHQ